MKRILMSFCLLALFYRRVSSVDPVGPIQGFIQTNFIGKPVIHDKQTWFFDPDVAFRRRKQFEFLHGVKGEKLIERIGLGVDGYEEERLYRQRQRDEGHLGGLNYFRP